MSSPYDPEYEAPDDDFLEEGYETDPEEEERFQEQYNETLAAFTAEQEEFNEDHKAFIEKYGFTHDCHCAADWEEGNLGVVSMCYLGMATDAMNTLADKIKELKEVNKENAKLRIELADINA